MIATGLQLHLENLENKSIPITISDSPKCLHGIQVRDEGDQGTPLVQEGRVARK